MAPFAERLAAARTVANHPAIEVSDVEAALGTRYTVDTLAALKRCFPHVRFVWIMGADNLVQLPRWRRWADIFRLVPIAVFGRAPYSSRALSGGAALAFARGRLHTRSARILADTRPPAWIFFHSRLHPASATAIRSATPPRKTRSMSRKGSKP